MDGLFTLSGIVKHGQNRGKQLGYPTMNIDCNESIPEGIYISVVNLDMVTYNAVTFIGTAKTFNEDHFQAETYILDFQKNVYGKEIGITLLKKLRNNKKFASEDELREQMEKDVEETRQYFAEHVGR